VILWDQVLACLVIVSPAIVILALRAAWDLFGPRKRDGI
jgi:hypothetical protein